MENKKIIKTFGKVLYVLAIIARVCLMIAVFFGVLFTIVIPIIFSKVKIDKNKISVFGIPETKIVVSKNDKDELKVVVNDKTVNMDEELSKTERLGAEVVFDMLTDTTKGAVIAYLEAGIVLSLVSMILVIIAIKSFENLCCNIKDKDEVFIIDNSLYLRKSAKFLLISYIVAIVASGVTSGIFTEDFSINYNSIGIVEIIVLYMLSYIFAYGNTLEMKKQEVIEIKESKPKVTRKRTTKKVEEK